MKFLKVILALALCITTYNAASQNNDTHHVAIIDAGSTGSRIYIFSWNSVDESGIPNLLPAKSPGTRKFGATTSPGVGDSSFTDAKEAANSLIPLINYANSVLSPEKLEKTPVFLNATGGMRLLNREKRKALKAAIRELFTEKHLMPSKNPKHAVRIIDGDEEGIYAWLGTNYFTGKFHQGDSTIGVLDLGGSSTQITYETDKQSGPGIHTVKVGKKTFQLFSHSFLGLGMNEAYKTLANRECLPLHFKSQEKTTNPFDACVQSNSTHMKSAVHGDPSLLQPIKDPKIASSDFYLISGYKDIHDYLMHLQHDNSSTSWLDFFRKNGEKACTLSPKELLTSNPNVSELEIPKYCFYSAYTVALLQKFGFDEHSHLEFKDKIPVDGQDVPLGWHLGAALLEAYKLQKSYDEATKPEGEPKKEKGMISAAIDMGFFGIVDKAANDATLKAVIGSTKGGIQAKQNTVINPSTPTSPDYDSNVNAYGENTFPSLPTTKTWRDTLLTPLNYIKLETALATYRGIRDPNRIWDIQALTDTSIGVLSLIKFAGTGIAVTAVTIPNAPAFVTLGAVATYAAGTSAALLKSAAIVGALNTIYFKLPPIRDWVDTHLFRFGENLQEMGELKSVYDWNSFANPETQNRPYLKCNFYKSKNDLFNGSKTIASEFVKRSDFNPLFENEKEIIPATSYYGDWVILSGRWMRIQQEKGPESMSQVRFGSIDNPFSLLEICLNTFSKKAKEGNTALKDFSEKPLSQDILDRVAPQAGYSSVTASYPIYFYAQINEKTSSGEVKKTARLLTGLEESKEQQKNIMLASKFLADDNLDKSGILQAHKMTSHSDVKNHYSDNLDAIMSLLLTSKRLLDHTNYYQFFDAFSAAYSSLNVMGKAFYANQAVSLDDITNAALNTVSASTMNIAGGANPGPLSKNVNANKFVAWGSLANTIQKYGLSMIYINSLDEVLHGTYLSGLKPVLDLNDLKDEKTIQKSHLFCQYYPSISSGGKIKDPLFTAWAPSSLLPKDSTVRVLPGHYYKVGTAVEKTEGPKQEFFAPLADNNGYIELKGRWVKTEDRGMVFATLADPAELLGACVGALNLEELIPTEHRKTPIGAIILSTGNTRATMGYAIEYYTPLVVWDGGEKTLKAVHLNEGSVKLAEDILKKHSGK